MGAIGNIYMRLGIQDNATGPAKNVFGKMFSMASTFAASFAGLKFFKGAIDEASDLAESTDALNSIFGESTRKLEEFSRTSSKAFGLSKSDVMSFGVEMSGVMSKTGLSTDQQVDSIIELQKRINDFSNQKNVQFDEIASGIESSLAGRASMALQKLGISLTDETIQTQIASGAFAEMGYSADQAFANLDDGAKAFLRIQSFMKQTSNQAGWFGKNLSTSFKEQKQQATATFADIKSQIGDKLLPTMINLFQWLNDNMQKVITTLGILGGAFLGFKLGSFIGQMIKAISLLMAMAAAKTAAQTGIGSFAAVPAVVGMIGAVVGGLVGGIMFSGIGSGGGASANGDQAAQVQKEAQFNVTVNVDSITGQAASNSAGRANIQTNLGRGGA